MDKFDGARKFFKKPAIQKVLREQTSGGVIFRRNKNDEIEFLMIQDAKDRWTIPKGHIEEGEKPDETARREITEETGIQEMKLHKWLGKVNFRYRREQSLVLITMQVFLVEALGNTSKVQKEEWMNDIRWFSVSDTLDKIEYEDIGKLFLLGLKKIRNNKLGLNKEKN
jgi:8-oxo-dGTP pyrophosphatase MutT (NUDIX family)